MLCGIVTETLALSFMMWRTNWDEEVFFILVKILCLENITRYLQNQRVNYDYIDIKQRLMKLSC